MFIRRVRLSLSKKYPISSPKDKLMSDLTFGSLSLVEFGPLSGRIPQRDNYHVWGDAKSKFRRPNVSDDYRMAFCNLRKNWGAKYRLKKKSHSAVPDIAYDLDAPLTRDIDAPPPRVAALSAIDAGNELVLVVSVLDDI